MDPWSGLRVYIGPEGHLLRERPSVEAAGESRLMGS